MNIKPTSLHKIALVLILATGCALPKTKKESKKTPEPIVPSPLVGFLCGAELKPLPQNLKAEVRRALAALATRPKEEFKSDRFAVDETSNTVSLPVLLESQFISHGAVQGKACCSENKSFWINVDEPGVKTLARKMVTNMDLTQDPVLVRCGAETLGKTNP